MALISQESLLGMLVPDIYIDGVTLESSGTPLLVDNPHIDDIRERQSRVAFAQAMDNRTLKVIVDLSLKEKLDNTLIGSWFRKQEFHKYLKIKVIETTHPGLIKLFSYNQNMINFATSGTSSINYFSASEINAIIGAIGSPEQAFHLFQNKDLYQSRILSVSADVVGDNSDLTQISSSLDEDGNSIHDFTYRATFEMNVLNPEELAVFAVSYLDLSALKDDYDLEFNVGTLDSQNGKAVSEKIISKGSIVSTAMAFTTPEGEFWTGPIHKTGKFSYASGSEPSASARKLTKRNVPNDVVQDFRDVAEIRKYSIDTSSADKAIDTIEGLRSSSSDKSPVQHQKTYFSNLWISRDSDGASRIMFGFDKGSFLKHNSPYGALLDRNSPDIRNRILSGSRVKQITLLRRRVKSVTTLNKLGSLSTGEVLFDKSEPYVSLIMTAAGSDGKLVERTNASASIRECEPVVTNTDSSISVDYYTGQDKQVSKFTDGLYQYGVRIEIEDGTLDYLRSITDNLLKIRENAKLYLTSASKLGMTKMLLEVADPHIDHTSERAASTIQSKGHYDPLRNRFTSKFIQFMNTEYNNTDSPFYKKRPWIDASIAYTNALSVLSRSAEADISSKKLNLDNKISKFMSPSSGTPMGIMAVISLYDSLIDKYRSLTGDDYRHRSSASMTPSASKQTAASDVSTGENSPPSLLKVENWFFNNHFDSNVSKATGLDYLTDSRRRSSNNLSQAMALNEYRQLATGAGQNRGLKIIDAGYWTGRIKSETIKYFTDLAPNINLSHGRDIFTESDSIASTSFGFLTPSYIISDNKAHTMSLEEDMSYYAKIESGLLATNNNSFTIMKDTTAKTNRTDTEKVYQSVLQSIFSDFNVTVSAVSTPTPLPQIYSRLNATPEQSICDAQQLQAVDPYPSWNIDSDGNVVAMPSEENREFFVGEKNSNFIDFFKKISSVAIADNVMAGDMSGQAKVVKIDRFDIRNDGNIFINLKEDGRLAQRILSANGGHTQTPTVSNVVSSFPNQIKSVFLGPLNSGLIRDNWSSQETDPLNDWMYSSKFNLNYQFISQVERFAGFEYVSTTSGKGRILSVKREKWVQLTEKYYLTSQGKEILCRLTPYVCNSLGLGAKRGLATPTYDEYFLIVPNKKGKIVSKRLNTEAKRRSAMESRWAQSSQTMGQFTKTNLIIK